VPTHGVGQVRRLGGTPEHTKKTKLLFWLFMVVFGYFYPHFQLQPIVLKQLALILGLAGLAALDFEAGGAKNAQTTPGCMAGPRGRNPHAPRHLGSNWDR
jgi:hypothetical protein